MKGSVCARVCVCVRTHAWGCVCPDRWCAEITGSSCCRKFHQVPGYFATWEENGRPCLYSLSMRIRYLRIVGMTQQVLENVPELRLSREALSPCPNQGE